MFYFVCVFLVELYAGLETGIPIIFRCCTSRFNVSEGCYITIHSGREATNMLANLSHMVDVASAECAVPADKERELRTIGEGNFAALNRTVAGSMMAGAQAAMNAVWEVDAFNCGEPEALRRLPSSRLEAAMVAAGSAGQVASLSYLLDERVSKLGVNLVEVLGEALIAAAANGHVAVVQLLLAAEGIDVNRVHQSDGAFPLLMAAQQGHAAVVRLLLAAEGIDVYQVNPSNGAFPLLMAAQIGHEAVVQLLLAVESVNVNQANPSNGAFPLLMAAQHGHAAVVQLLLEADGVNVNLRNLIYGNFPLLMAAKNGDSAVVRLLLMAEGLEVNQIDPSNGNFPLLMAAYHGNAEAARLLLARGADRSMTIHGMTALDIAIKTGHAQVAAVFLS